MGAKPPKKRPPGASRSSGATYPRNVLDECRRLYETTATSLRKLGRANLIPWTVLRDVATLEGWQQPGWEQREQEAVIKAAEAIAEDGVLAAGLQVPPQPPDPPPPTRMAGYSRNGKRLGRPKKYLRMKDAAPLTREQQRMQCVREEWEGTNLSLSWLAQKYGFTSAKLSYVCRLQGWQRQVPDPGAPPATPPPPTPSDQPAQPASRSSKGSDKPDLRVVPPADDAIRSAHILDFPGRRPGSPKKADPIMLLPERTVEEQAQIRVTLAAIRAQMSVEQVTQLEQHEGLLLRYHHLFEVYFEPQRFVDRADLTLDEYVDRVIAAQRIARGMLLPTERDTLAGSLKALTEAMRHNIELKRMVAGLGKTSAAALSFDDPNASGGKLIETDALDNTQLRAVQTAMELLDRHHRRSTEPPKPPAPDSIDDLLGPAPVVIQEPANESGDPDPEVPGR